MCTSAQCALRTTIQNCFISCPSSSTNPTLLQCIDFCFFCIDQRFQFSSALLCIGSHSASLCNWFIQSLEVIWSRFFSLIIFLQRSYAIDHQLMCIKYRTIWEEKKKTKWYLKRSTYKATAVLTILSCHQGPDNSCEEALVSLSHLAVSLPSGWHMDHIYILDSKFEVLITFTLASLWSIRESDLCLNWPNADFWSLWWWLLSENWR